MAVIDLVTNWWLIQAATGSCGDAGADCGGDYWLVKVGTAQIFFCLSIQTYDSRSIRRSEPCIKIIFIIRIKI